MKPLFFIPLISILLMTPFSVNAAGSMLRITCDGDAEGAEVLVNGKFKGQCPLDVTVPEGTIKLRVQKKVDDLHDPRLFEQELRMGDGVVKKIEVQLGKAEINAAGKQHEADLIAERERREEEAARQVILRKEEEARQVILRKEEEARQVNLRKEEAARKEKIRQDEIIAAIEAGMVSIPGKNYAMGKYTVTRGQFAAFVKETGYDTGNACVALIGTQWLETSGKNWRNPGFAQDDNHPVACINWNDANAFSQWLSKKTGKQYRLPNEDEWKFACDGGSIHEYCGSDDINSVAWYKDNSGKSTHAVGQKQANGYGLYDMSGNVWQWMENIYDNEYDKSHVVRALRGGSWNFMSKDVRAAYRFSFSPEYRYDISGFRLARTLP